MRDWYFWASLPPMALRSMPAQNVPPAPVRMAQRMSSLPSISSQASFMPTSMGRLSAFFASGRFMVTMAVAPSRSNVRCSVVTTVPSRGRRRNGDAEASEYRSEPLDDGARRQRAAAAHRDQPVGAVGPLELVEDRGDQPAPGGADRVAERDG